MNKVTKDGRNFPSNAFLNCPNFSTDKGYHILVKVNINFPVFRYSNSLNLCYFDLQTEKLNQKIINSKLTDKFQVLL